MHHFLQTIGKQLGCATMTWIGSTLDKDVSAVPATELIKNWFVVDLINIELTPCPLSLEEQYALYFQLMNAHGIDPLTAYAVEEVGQVRGYIRSEFYDNDAWAQHWHFREYLSHMGMSEGMVTGYPVGEKCESYITYQRGKEAPPFTKEEKEFAITATAGIAQLHQRLMLLRGALSPEGKLLSPQEKVIIKSLLGGKQEKEIAAELDIAPSTAHNHISTIYRKYGVSGKSGLISQILG